MYTHDAERDIIFRINCPEITRNVETVFMEYIDDEALATSTCHATGPFNVKHAV
jgi:hypothetical protein